MNAWVCRDCEEADLDVYLSKHPPLKRNLFDGLFCYTASCTATERAMIPRTLWAAMGGPEIDPAGGPFKITGITIERKAANEKE
jgi:hypothetical protein